MGENRQELEQFLRIADVATELRKQREEVGKQLDDVQQKQEIKKKILATAKVTGEKLTDIDADVAINAYFSGLYSFKEPERTFSYKLAEMYVRRGWIWKHIIMPTTLVVAIASAIGGFATMGYKSHMRDLERKVETAVEQAYQKEKKQKVELEGLLSRHVAEIDAVAVNSQKKLLSADDFFNSYCPAESAKDTITRENFKDVEQKLNGVTATLSAVDEDIKRGKGILKLDSDLMQERKTLETLITQVRDEKPPTVLLDRAESAYSDGLLSLDKKQLPQALICQKQIEDVKRDANDYKMLPKKVEQLKNSIFAVAKEDKAKQQADSLYEEAQLCVKNVDVPKLSQAVSKLKDLDEVLNQEYTVSIVSKPNVKSGMDRYYTDEKGKRSSGYYLILEAKDASGKIIQRQIKNEEDGKVSTVQMWGERVPQSVYEKVKKDKMDNGRIDDGLVAKKAKGYIEETMIFKDDKRKILEKKGQITHW